MASILYKSTSIPAIIASIANIMSNRHNSVNKDIIQESFISFIIININLYI